MLLCAAGASERTSALAWVRLPGAEQCIGSVELARAVETRLGRAVFVPTPRAERIVEASIAPSGSGFGALLSVADQRGRILGQRELSTTSTDCRSLDRALVLVLALLIDAEAIPPAPPRPLTPAPPSEPGPVASGVNPPRGAPALVFAADVVGAFVLGRLPGAAPGAMISVELGGASGLRARLSGELFLGNAATDRGAKTRFILAGGLAGVGWVAPLGRGFDLSGFLSAELADLIAEPIDLLSPVNAEAMFLALELSGGLSYQPAAIPLRFRAGLALGVPLLRGSFTYLDATGRDRALFQPEPIIGRMEVGLGVQLP